jgi:transposase
VNEIAMIGVDLAKNVFQLHGVDATHHVVLRRQLRRTQMLPFFAKLPPCVVVVEACGSAHYWAREIGVLGHEVRLVPPAYARAFAKRGKSDSIDAEAVCEAGARPSMRFVPVKSAEAQALATLHRTRALLDKRRTMLQIPTKSPTYSNLNAPTIPISSRPSFRDDLARGHGASLAVKI